MLALTPRPLQTAGERALFAELTRWDTGGAVRGAVVASLPVVDGPVGRRLCDAVLFVPEGWPSSASPRWCASAAW